VTDADDRPAIELADLAAVGGRFAGGDRRPTLAWVLFHVLQEYARHAGHLESPASCSTARPASSAPGR